MIPALRDSYSFSVQELRRPPLLVFMQPTVHAVALQQFVMRPLLD
jgi:hypothetical protein